MKTLKTAVPFKWPFPPAPKAKPQGAEGKKQRSAPLPGAVSRKGMLADVVMVIFWGASIPGLIRPRRHRYRERQCG